jgi:hypothetical protein
MITELQVMPQEVLPGHKIMVTEYQIRNYRMHASLEGLSRLTLYTLECDSNNTVTKVTPRNARAILAQWSVVKDEFEFALAHNDTPTGSYEMGYKVNLLHQTQIQRVRNVKMKRVITELFNLAQVLMSVDSANTQGYIAPDDEATVKETFRVVDDVIARWLGDGTFGNLGKTAPAFEILGDIVPNESGSYAVMMEPSAIRPMGQLPDVPDLEQTNRESLPVGGTPVTGTGTSATNAYSYSNK